MDIKSISIKGHKQTLNTTDINAAATTQTVQLHGAKGYLLGFQVKVTTAFAGVTTPTLKVGFTGYLDYLVPKQSIASAKPLKTGKQHQFFCEGQSVFTGTSSSANQGIVATFESVSGNFSSLTAGAVEILVIYAE